VPAVVVLISTSKLPGVAKFKLPVLRIPVSVTGEPGETKPVAILLTWPAIVPTPPKMAELFTFTGPVPLFTPLTNSVPKLTSVVPVASDE
jgi:hypothetical protein